MANAIPEQARMFPKTRFMGSKYKLLPHLHQVVQGIEFETAIDAFSGSGVVSYLFKTLGKRVIANDHMHMSTAFARALIANNSVRLSDTQIERILQKAPNNDKFVQKTFKGLYFSDADNRVIDDIRFNIGTLRNSEARSIALASLIRACMKRRPRGVFTYVGDRYDDGRQDLRLTIKEHFELAVQQVNSAVFDNGKRNEARNADVMSLRVLKRSLVYLDPPYFTPKSDNQYVRRYHFVEGLARDWQGIDIQQHTVTKKFKSYDTPFSTREGATAAFEKLFQRFKDSAILVSYSSNALPTLDEIVDLMSKYKSEVKVIPVNHRYSFGNQGFKVGDNRNEVKEYLFLGLT